jgi:hypothetical protein
MPNLKQESGGAKVRTDESKAYVHTSILPDFHASMTYAELT